MGGTNKVELILDDICYPDFYRGTSGFSLAVFLSPDMSKTDMISAINSEVQNHMEFPFDYAAFDVAMREWVEEFHDWVIRDLLSFPDNDAIPYAYFSVFPMSDSILSDSMNLS